MERLSDTAIEVINNMHTERLEYNREYIHLIDAVNLLSVYEDTGLTPEEIVKMGMAWEDSKRYAWRLELKLKAYEDLGPVARLRELAQADKDGRLAVLPPQAKLGDPKPECFYNECAGIWCIGCSHGEDDEPTDRCKQCWYCENGELEDD